jgi:hypothetical protein
METTVRRIYFNPADLQVAEPNTLLKHYDQVCVERLPFYSVRVYDQTIIFDPITLIETFVADDEPTFRLLMSPFRDSAIFCVAERGMVSLCTHLGSFCHPSKGDRPLPLLPQALCIAKWFSYKDGRRELDRCANALRSGRPVYVPKLPEETFIEVSGIAGEKHFFVQRILTPRPAAWWRAPVPTVRFVHVGAERGVEFFRSGGKWFRKEISRKDLQLDCHLGRFAHAFRKMQGAHAPVPAKVAFS